MRLLCELKRSTVSDNFIRVEVAYAKPDNQAIKVVTAPVGTRVEEAIKLSDIQELFPEIEVTPKLKVGLWGKACKLDTELHDGDRVEIYRPLIADPKEARKNRAAKAAGK